MCFPQHGLVIGLSAGGFQGKIALWYFSQAEELPISLSVFSMNRILITVIALLFSSLSGVSGDITKE